MNMYMDIYIQTFDVEGEKERDQGRERRTERKRESQRDMMTYLGLSSDCSCVVSMVRKGHMTPSLGTESVS